MKKAIKVLLGIAAAGAFVSAIVYAIKKFNDGKKCSCDDYFDYTEEDDKDAE